MSGRCAIGIALWTGTGLIPPYVSTRLALPLGGRPQPLLLLAMLSLGGFAGAIGGGLVLGGW